MIFLSLCRKNVNLLMALNEISTKVPQIKTIVVTLYRHYNKEYGE